MTVDNATLEKTLAGLGKTSLGIARRLADKKIRGIPEDDRHCAIAEYLRKEFPDEGTISVSPCEVQVNGASVVPSEAVGTFIKLFDEQRLLRLVQHHPVRGVQCTGAPIWDADRDTRTDKEYWVNVHCECGAIEQDFALDLSGERTKARDLQRRMAAAVIA